MSAWAKSNRCSASMDRVHSYQCQAKARMGDDDPLLPVVIGSSQLVHVGKYDGEIAFFFLFLFYNFLFPAWRHVTRIIVC